MEELTHQWRNKLYFGDNLEILRDKIRDNSVDLIYLDPPFKGGKAYNLKKSSRQVYNTSKRN